MKQQTLLLEPRSHATDPHTSFAAAHAVADTATARRVQILTALKLHGPMTSHEIAAKLDLHWSDVARRCTELLESHQIMRTERGIYLGKPIYWTRRTPSGKAACVWRLA